MIIKNGLPLSQKCPGLDNVFPGHCNSNWRIFKCTWKKGKGMTDWERGESSRLEGLHKEGSTFPAQWRVCWNAPEALDVRRVQAPGKVRRSQQSSGVEELLPHLCDPTRSKDVQRKGLGQRTGKVSQVTGLWPKEAAAHKIKWGTSQLDQWLRICLPMQGTRVWSVVLGDPTCQRAGKPVIHSERSQHSTTERKPAHGNEDP